ncbi:unnamed protein product, partial [Meganyctiphanes norvegica]
QVPCIYFIFITISLSTMCISKPNSRYNEYIPVYSLLDSISVPRVNKKSSNNVYNNTQTNKKMSQCSASSAESDAASAAASAVYEDQLQLVYNNPRFYNRMFNTKRKMKYLPPVTQIEGPDISPLYGLAEVGKTGGESGIKDSVWGRTTLFNKEKPDVGLQHYLGEKYKQLPIASQDP